MRDVLTGVPTPRRAAAARAGAHLTRAALRPSLVVYIPPAALHVHMNLLLGTSAVPFDVRPAPGRVGSVGTTFRNSVIPFTSKIVEWKTILRYLTRIDINSERCEILNCIKCKGKLYLSLSSILANRCSLSHFDK